MKSNKVMRELHYRTLAGGFVNFNVGKFQMLALFSSKIDCSLNKGLPSYIKNNIFTNLFFLSYKILCTQDFL